jgi:hypothetical protein
MFSGEKHGTRGHDRQKTLKKQQFLKNFHFFTIFSLSIKAKSVLNTIYIGRRRKSLEGVVYEILFEGGRGMAGGCAGAGRVFAEGWGRVFGRRGAVGCGACADFGFAAVFVGG